MIWSNTTYPKQNINQYIQFDIVTDPNKRTSDSDRCLEENASDRIDIIVPNNGNRMHVIHTLFKSTLMSVNSKDIGFIRDHPEHNNFYSLTKNELY